jgi:N-acetylneuraminate synthase
MPRKTIIIAEAGVNHNGSVENAKKLIDAAADSGADYVKFQTFITKNIVTKGAEKAVYQIENIGEEAGVSQFDMLKALELDRETHEILINYCGQKGIKFLSTSFDLESTDYLAELHLEVFKIPSGEITNEPYLIKIAGLGKPVIMSTGMCTLDEVKAAHQVLLDHGMDKKNIIILHCNTEYPTPMEDVNLRAMLTLGKELDAQIGYSDHTLGIEIPIAAVAMGASVIEKHFTLDRNMKGPDHRASLEPDELKQMIQSIRNIELALGDGVKKPSASEIKNIIPARKSIHLKRNLNAGDKITLADLEMLRPGDGISPFELSKVIDRSAKQNLERGTKLLWNDLV